jgi:anti-sigma-K factor RskA
MTMRPEDIPMIADEFVLGLLDPAEARAVESEMKSNPALRKAIAESRDRFLPLDTAAEEANGDYALWVRIEQSLPAHSVQSIEALPEPQNDNTAKRWRLTAISSIAATLLLAVGLAWSLLRTIEPVVVAVLLNDAGEIQAVVEDFGNDTASVRLLKSFDVPEDKTIQVWTLPSTDLGPVSLGILSGTRSATLQWPGLPMPKQDQLYELTLEQAGGSSTGRPTGPILAKGFALPVH